jgi:hypothetical protein
MSFNSFYKKLLALTNNKEMNEAKRKTKSREVGWGRGVK